MKYNNGFPACFYIISKFQYEITEHKPIKYTILPIAMKSLSLPLTKMPCVCYNTHGIGGGGCYSPCKMECCSVLLQAKLYERGSVFIYRQPNCAYISTRDRRMLTSKLKKAIHSARDIVSSSFFDIKEDCTSQSVTSQFDNSTIILSAQLIFYNCWQILLCILTFLNQYIPCAKLA